MDVGNQWEGQVVPADQDILGYCTECIRMRWLGVVDHMEGTVPFGTCRSCVRAAEEGGSE